VAGKWGLVSLLLASGTLLAACASGGGEPDRVRVQHVLVGFEGSVPGRAVQRSRAEAASLAAEIAQSARRGEDFAALMRRFSDDAGTGTYGLVRDGIAPLGDLLPRRAFVPGFGDAAFGLAAGEIALVPHDAERSPYGWHVLRRVD
jgi:hypothetical protein